MNVSIDTLRRFEIEADATIYIGWGLRTIAVTISEFVNSRESIDEATTLEIYSKDGFCKFVAPKSKEITIEYLFDRLNKYTNQGRAYENLSGLFSKLLPSCNFYATSYGVGLDAFLKSHARVLEVAQPLVEILLKNGIDFNTEYSDAAWVFRFKISKSKDNIEKLKNLIV